MSKQTNTFRTRKTTGAAVLATLRVMVVFLLLTHQALANLLCCGAMESEPQASCHLNAAESVTAAKAPASLIENAESTPCHADEANQPAPPNVNERFIRFGQPVNTLPWCCHEAPVAEPQPLISLFDEQSLVNIAPVFFALPATQFSSPDIVLSPPPKSRPIFLTISCLLI